MDKGPTISDVIAAGVYPSPYNHPTRITFEYSSGATLVLEDEILVEFWREYIHTRSFLQRVNSTPDPYSMSAVREAMNRKGPFNKKDTESE